MIPNCQHSESITKIAAALAKALPAIDAAKKDASNPAFRSKYADLTSIVDAYKEQLGLVGIAVMQPPSSREDGSAVVTTILLHESGEWMSSELALRPVKTDPQGMGSAITYARRYGAQGMLGISADDDDGNAASGTGSKSAAQAVAGKRIEELKKPTNNVAKSAELKALLEMEPDNAFAVLKGMLTNLIDDDFAQQCYQDAKASGLSPKKDSEMFIKTLYNAYVSNQPPKEGVA